MKRVDRPKRKIIPRSLLLLLIINLVMSTLVLGSPIPAAHAQPSGDEPALTTCDDIAEDDLRTELNSIAQQIFSSGAESIDLAAIVERQWNAHDLDRAVDSSVTAAVAQVQSSEDLWNTFLSGWSPQKAEELTRTVAELAFGSEPFRLAIEEMSAGIATEIETSVAALSAESVSYNLICLQEFISERYSAAIVEAFQREVQQGVSEIELLDEGSVDNSILTVLKVHRTALSGVGVIIAAQVAKKVVQRIGKQISRRVAGRVAGRVLGKAGSTLIPLAGWIVGTGLIVYDVLDSLDGALPQIEQSLRSPDVKAAVRAEIVATVEPELRREIPEVAREVANDLYAEWLEFRRKYRQVLDVAATNPELRVLLEDGSDLAQVVELLDAYVASLGLDAALTDIGSGVFRQLLGLPVSSYQMLRATGSPATLLAWADIAGPQLERLVDLELYNVQEPEMLDASTLNRLLELDDAQAIAALAAVEPATLETLFRISRANLETLAGALDSTQLAELGALLRELPEDQGSRLVTMLARQPQLLDQVTQERVRNAIADGNDIADVLAFVAGPVDGLSLLNDGAMLVTRGVSLRLFAAKYGTLPTILMVVVPFLLVAGVLYTVVSIILRPFVGLAGLFRRRR